MSNRQLPPPPPDAVYIESDPRYPPVTRSYPQPGPPPMVGSRRPATDTRAPGPPLPPRTVDMIVEQKAGRLLSPPPVPNTPRPNIEIPHKTLQYPSRDESFTLPELVAQHQALFPLRVVVVKGFFGDRGEDSAIATDEVYNIHFIKKSKVYTMRDTYKHDYIVPLNTACKFGLYYQKGTCYFDTVEDLLKASPMPLVVAAQTHYTGSSEKNSLHRLEILIIKGVTKGRLRMTKTTLNVHSLRTNEEKQLTKEVFGRFTTDPTYTFMYLTDLIKHVPLTLPVDAHLFIEFDSEEPPPDYLTSEKVTIVNDFIETSVVTTPLYEDSDGSKNFVVLNEKAVDIPLSLPIEVSVLPPEEDESDDYEDLYEATRNLYTGYNPVLGKTYRDAADDYSYTTQTQIFSAVRKGFESEGLNIQLPQNISSSRLPSSQEGAGNRDKRRSKYQPLIRPVSEDEYQEMDYVQPDSNQSSRQSSMSPSRSYDSGFTPSRVARSESVRLPSGPPGVPPRRTPSTATHNGREIPSPRSSVSTPPAVKSRRTSSSADGVFLPRQTSQPPPSSPSPKIVKLQRCVDSLLSRVEVMESMKNSASESSELKQHLDALVPLTKSLQTTCQSLEAEVKTMRTDMEALKKQVATLSNVGVSPTDDQSTQNTVLQTLDPDQILKLLEAMGPSIAKHKETFNREGIDGELLSHCTEEILETELGVKAKLERLKLMQVIHGTKSIESIMQGSYVRFQFNGGQSS